MADELSEVQSIYDRLWQKTAAALEAGEVRVDPLLRQKALDHRRGVTLAVRPEMNVRNRVQNFLRAAAAICPGQYYYQPQELHVTVLALIPGTQLWRKEIQHVRIFRRALDEVVKQGRGFAVNFRGVTVSPASVTSCATPCAGVGLATIWTVGTKSPRPI
jgi:hypothetical protein